MIWVWLGFLTLIASLLALDLGVFHRRAHVISIRESLCWSAVWITLGLLFGAFVYWGYEHQLLHLGNRVDPVDGRINSGASALIKYLTGYVVEKSLSIDNIFVMAMIFGSLRVPPLYQHRVLFWGILGAIALRGAMIAAGANLIAHRSWILYLFGVFLLFTAIKMLVVRESQEPAENFVARAVKHLVPMTDRFHENCFFVRAGSADSHRPVSPGVQTLPDRAVDHARTGALMMTPLALSLLLIETTDVIFAVDSIPAIFAITADPFLVFTSNIFAILGLRSLYFALGGLMDRFRYLKVSLAIILAVVGLKMLLVKQLKENLGGAFNLYLLLVVVVIMTAGVLASINVDRKEEAARCRVPSI